MNTLSEVYLTHSAAFLPNAPVGNDEMEAVLGMVGDTPSRVRQMILRSNGFRSRHYAIDPAGRAATHTTAELAAAAACGVGALCGVLGGDYSHGGAGERAAQALVCAFAGR